MRQTAKYAQACITAQREEGIVTDGVPHDDLYNALEAACWAWNAKAGQWQKQARPVTSSMFGDSDDASGVSRLRLMAHPDEIDTLTADVRDAMRDKGYKVVETSDKYPNRRGIGTRVYVTLMKG